MPDAAKPYVLVTGAGGFIGRNLTGHLQQANFPLRLALRTQTAATPAASDVALMGDVDESTDWTAALKDVDVVIHLLGRAHILRETVSDPLEEFRRINTKVTENLARQAVQQGVRRFIFVSSIGVNGEATAPGQSFNNSSVPQPQSTYAVAKWEAEQRLHQLQADSGLEVVVVRPPLVYGPGAPGNISRLIRLVDSGFPLPFANADNRRSFISVDNLSDFLIRCVETPQPSALYLVSDGQDLSTNAFTELIAQALGRNLVLFPIPKTFTRTVFQWLGKQRIFDQLWGDLVVDSRQAREALNWEPSVSPSEGIAMMVSAYRDARRAPTE